MRTSIISHAALAPYCLRNLIQSLAEHNNGELSLSDVEYVTEQMDNLKGSVNTILGGEIDYVFDSVIQALGMRGATTETVISLLSKAVDVVLHEFRCRACFVLDRSGLYRILCKQPFHGCQILPSNMMLKWLSAATQSLIGRFHFIEILCIAKYSTFLTESAVGNEPRFLVTFRS